MCYGHKSVFIKNKLIHCDSWNSFIKYLYAIVYIFTMNYLQRRCSSRQSDHLYFYITIYNVIILFVNDD